MVIEYIHKFVNDLGIAAYLLMHGYNVIGKTGRSIYFECENNIEAEALEDLEFEYAPPNEFYIFDSCLMYLKKINDRDPKVPIDESIHKVVTDLGIAAYLLMLECDKDRKLDLKIIGKRGKNVYFQHPVDKGNEFKRRSYLYLSSQFQNYDSSLVGLKKIDEYIPTNDFKAK